MFCWARQVFIFVVVVLGMSSIIGACGQKGPLTVPPPPDQATPESDIPQLSPIPDRVERS